MEKLEKKDLIMIGVMIFSLFFGAGNLIFPPFLGENAGDNTSIAMLGFIMTAVGLPILALIAVARVGDMYDLASRVGKGYARFFSLIVALTIGPFLGIPRAGSLPFEMAIAPFISTRERTVSLFLLAYTLVFFLLVYRLAMNPGKLVDRMGKIITPMLLSLLVLIFIRTLALDGLVSRPAGKLYRDQALLRGFLDGYMTLDAIAGLNFGFIIYSLIRSKGLEDGDSIVRATKISGLLAAVLLSTVYLSLAYIGRVSGGIFSPTKNGAETLGNIMVHLFGDFGQLILALVFTLACLNSAIGVTTAVSRGINKLYPSLKYENLVRLTILVSLFIANLGLDKIIKISVPILNMVYPMAIVLIILSLFDKYFDNAYIYRFSIYVTGFISIINVLNDLGLPLGFIESLPLYDLEMVWLLPSVLAILAGIIYKFYRKKRGKLEKTV